MEEIYYEKVRIYPNLRQIASLEKYLDINRGLYNGVVYQQRKALAAYAATFNTGIFDETVEAEFPNYRKESVALTLRRNGSLRLASVHSEFQAGSLKRVFNAINARTTGGKLRFKNRNSFSTITMSHADRTVRFSPNGSKIRFCKEIGFIRLKSGRSIPENFTVFSLHRSKTGKFYAIFVCKRECITLPQTNQNIGIDLGITNILATSSGDLIQNPRYVEQKKAELVLLQQKFAAGKYKDGNLRKQIAILHEKIANKIRDFHHKLALKIVVCNDVIALEDLSLVKMKEKGPKPTRKGLQNVGLGKLTKYICDKAESAGRKIVKVNPAYTSQTCSDCGFCDNKNRSGEKFECLNCGIKKHADINAACNVLSKGLEEASKNLYSPCGKG